MSLNKVKEMEVDGEQTLKSLISPSALSGWVGLGWFRLG
jgi:hypothetical protein